MGLPLAILEVKQVLVLVPVAGSPAMTACGTAKSMAEVEMG